MGSDPAASMFLVMAEKDCTTMRKMLHDPDFPDEVFGFHAQQAVEKAAKAILAAQGVIFERTHDLETLFHSLKDNDCLGSEDFWDLVELTDFAVQYRYQAFDAFDEGVDRKTVAKHVEAFLAHARTRLVDTGADKI